MKMYQEKLMDHFKYPRHTAVIKNPDFSSGEFNPSCGDSVEISGNIKEGLLTEVSFSGAGCIISQAAASMLLEAVCGKSLQEILELSPDSMKQLVGTEFGPMRLRCVTLSLEALQKGVRQYLEKKC